MLKFNFSHVFLCFSILIFSFATFNTLRGDNLEKSLDAECWVCGYSDCIPANLNQKGGTECAASHGICAPSGDGCGVYDYPIEEEE